MVDPTKLTYCFSTLYQYKDSSLYNCSMDQLPGLALSHIGSFLTTKEILACHQAAKALKPVCQGVTSHTVKINTNEDAESLGQLLACILAVLPWLRQIKINLNHINTVTPASKSICVPGVLIKLKFSSICSEAAVDSIIDWFVQEPEVSIYRICITGDERFLRHRIMRLNTSIFTRNANLLKNETISKIPMLKLTVYIEHLDLSNISVDHNRELIINHKSSYFFCTDPWKITGLVYDISGYKWASMFESMRQDPMMSKSSRMKQVIVNGDIDIPSLSREEPCIHLGKLLPKSVNWLVQPNGPIVIAIIQDLLKVGADSLGYRVCSQYEYLEARLLRSLYPDYRFDIIFGKEFKLEKAKTLQDIFDGMQTEQRIKWLAVEKMLTGDQLKANCK